MRKAVTEFLSEKVTNLMTPINVNVVTVHNEQYAYIQRYLEGPVVVNREFLTKQQNMDECSTRGSQKTKSQKFNGCPI